LQGNTFKILRVSMLIGIYSDIKNLIGSAYPVILDNNQEIMIQSTRNNT
jgi:hypothetical protein